ncbi:VOC family protein [Methylocystis parvus]|uniref:VOC family protein n=1 Tax=Methylocystis parvus TaxID=134 RepID=A0A6B8M5D9_9HYPH|nr:VOC family protein [Methylocystis parvus]QGM98151.1 VOC family protein [Methylocystis parvus]WBK01528.1 VOC family protein [Methylocystis parvus OBBP]
MRLGYVIIYVSDLEETVAFYEKAFCVSRRFLHESGYAEMETGATALAFASEKLAAANGVATRRNRPDAEAAGAEIAFVSDDVPAAFAKAVAAGAAAYKQPEKKPWGQVVAYVRDNNGFLVEICSPAGV